jgi:hypothetical protein
VGTSNKSRANHRDIQTLRGFGHCEFKEDRRISYLRPGGAGVYLKLARFFQFPGRRW